MKKIYFTLIFIFVTSFFQKDNFLESQKKFSRVRNAIDEKQEFIEEKLNKFNLTISNFNILLIAYKSESILDIYVKSKEGSKYTKFLRYTICKSSGELGPKRQSGDNQVPEGFYYIDKFNPSSNFHLSLGLNYPNSSDKLKSKAKNLGGEIFIHGNCVTIGCLPMTDEKIKEIYLLSVFAKNNGQSKIPVYIFPFQMVENKMKFAKQNFEDKKSLLFFWENIKKGHDLFHKNFKSLSYSVDKNGDYLFQ